MFAFDMHVIHASAGCAAQATAGTRPCRALLHITDAFSRMHNPLSLLISICLGHGANGSFPISHLMPLPSLKQQCLSPVTSSARSLTPSHSTAQPQTNPCNAHHLLPAVPWSLIPSHSTAQPQTTPAMLLSLTSAHLGHPVRLEPAHFLSRCRGHQQQLQAAAAAAATTTLAPPACPVRSSLHSICTTSL